MEISFDPAKRERTLAERGLDFREAADVFIGNVYEFEDDRRDYGEVRMVTVGRLRGRMLVIAWTERNGIRHVFSMRKANDREQKFYGLYVGRPG